jgi:hypothetical protein
VLSSVSNVPINVKSVVKLPIFNRPAFPTCKYILFGCSYSYITSIIINIFVPDFVNCDDVPDIRFKLSLLSVSDCCYYIFNLFI